MNLLRDILSPHFSISLLIISLSQLSPVYMIAYVNIFLSISPAFFSSKLLNVSFKFLEGEDCSSSWFGIGYYSIKLCYFGVFIRQNITVILSIHYFRQIQINANLILPKIQKHCQPDKYTNIKTQNDNNKLVNSMIENAIGLKRCQNCHKLIEPMKLSLHYMMCSTAYLRRSQCSFMQPKPLKKCMFCMQQFCQQQFDYHTKIGCKHRLVPCIDCDDMFPLSLFTQHLQVCRAKQQLKQLKQQKQEKQQSTFFNSLMDGITTLGVALYDKGSEAATYCSQKIQQNKPTAMLYYEQIKARISDKFEDLFVSLAYDENVEGMPRGQIRKIKITSYKNQSKGQQQVCTICFCDLQELEPIKELRCKHIYHPTCIDKWLRINRTCPLCKMDQMQ